MPTFPPRAHGSGHAYGSWYPIAPLGPHPEGDHYVSFLLARAHMLPNGQTTQTASYMSSDQNRITHKLPTAKHKLTGRALVQSLADVAEQAGRRLGRGRDGRHGGLLLSGRCRRGRLGATSSLGRIGHLGASRGLLKMRRGARTRGPRENGSGLSPSDLPPYTDIPHVDSVPESCAAYWKRGARAIKRLTPRPWITQEGQRDKESGKAKEQASKQEDTDTEPPGKK